MLSHALERVLSVVRMPAGALFLHHGHAQGPTSVVAVGLAENFCAIAQEGGLDDHLGAMVGAWAGSSFFAIWGATLPGRLWKARRPSGDSGSWPRASVCEQSWGLACKPR